MQKTTFLFLVAIFELLSAASAFAHSNGSLTARQTLASMRPANYVVSGKCDIRIDCPHYKITVNGENAGQIICARTSGANFTHKTVRLATSLSRSSGKYMPRGFPMLDTEPSLCSGCFIHAYPWVGPGHKSLGCVGITEAAWDKIVRCGGSQISFTAMNGAQSNVPRSTEFADESLAPVSREASISH